MHKRLFCAYNNDHVHIHLHVRRLFIEVYSSVGFHRCLVVDSDLLVGVD